MATLSDLYRSRRGEVEQVENFLSGSLGLLLRSCPPARQILARVLDYPATGALRVVAQEELYNGNTPAGRPDLRIDHRDGHGVFSLIIEAKFDMAADVGQLRRYAAAIGSQGRVVLLSARAADRKKADEAKVAHVTWHDIANAVFPLRGEPLVDDFLALLSERDVNPARVVHAARLAEPLPRRLADFNGAVRNLLPELVPAPFDAAVRRLLKDDWGYFHDGGGFVLDLDEDTASTAKLAYATLGLTADRTALGGVSLSLWTWPLAKKLRGHLLRDRWTEGEEQYLRADVGTFWPEDSLDHILQEAAARARKLLTVPRTVKQRNGLWVGSPFQPASVDKIDGTVADLIADAGAVEEVAGAAEAISDVWLASLRDALGGDAKCRRISAFHDGSFYHKDGRFQVAARAYPGEAEEALYSWVWFRDGAAKERFAALAAAEGWGTRPDGKQGRGSVVLWPRVGPDEILDNARATQLGQALGALIQRSSA